MLKSKKRILKVVVSMICIIAMIMPYCTAVFEEISLTSINPANGKVENSTTATVEVLQLHEGGEESSGTLSNPSAYDKTRYAYKVGSVNVLKLVESLTSGYNFENQIFCLRAQNIFRPEDGAQKYTYRASLKSTSNSYVNEYKTKYNISDADFKALLCLFDNVYLRHQMPEQKDEILAKAFANKIAEDEANNVIPATTVDMIKTYLTDDDIEVIEQWAIWYFTDGDNSKYRADTIENSFAQVSVSTNGNTDFNAVSATRQEYAAILYKYLIEDAKSKASSTENKVAPTLTSESNVAVLEDEYYVLGPISLNLGSYTAEDITDLRVLDQNKNEISSDKYKIKIKGESDFTTKSINEILNQEYYIYIPINEASITKLEVSAKYNVCYTEPSYWTPEDSQYQPIVTIDRENIPMPLEVKIDINQKKFDLALRKFIVKYGETNTDSTRNPNVEGNIDVTHLISGDKDTAEYYHTKNPLTVKVGDKVVYQINVYNEGDIAGAATQIKDYLPEGLSYVPREESQINSEYGWVISPDGRTATTAYTAGTTLNAFNKETRELDSTYVQIECVVDEDVAPGTILTNVAEITADVPEYISDRDSEPGSIDATTIDSQTYTGNRENDSDLSKTKYFYKGIQDDDDFEKVIVIKDTKFDLALKKFISQKNDEKITNREPKVNVDKLRDGTSTTAEYTQVKTPLTAEIGDIIIYTLRVYNEGDISGYAEQVSDMLPEGLGFIINHKVNIDNYWSIPSNSKSIKLTEIANGTKNVKLDDFVDVTSLENVEVVPGQVKLTSTKLKYNENDDSNLIEAFDKDKENSTLDYKDIQVACIFIGSNSTFTFKNVAEIEKDLDKDGKEIDDIDSTPGNVEEKNEDDDDYEIVTLVPKVFDLALRKFITKVDDTDITTRIPQVGVDTNGNIAYVHPKDPVQTANGQLVTYTIRVFNEGETDGYASEITDNIPQGLEFVPGNEENQKYGWLMYDADGNQTTDLAKAVSIKTDYLSKEKSEARNENCLIKAFDESKEISNDVNNPNPDYRDVKVVFKVTESNLNSDRIIENIATVTKMHDKDGNPTVDKDTDDLTDKEYVKVKYFDLALKKYVSKVVVIEDSEINETLTNFTGDEDPKPLVKVDVHKRKLDSTIVKFVYTIKVTNQGEIAGYATEIKDYIPEGLEFYQEDNKVWSEISEGVIATNALMKTLLQPGESAEVPVTLRWKNDEDNLGIKINVAEISEDYNEYNSKDIDSTPDNVDINTHPKDKQLEDDDDFARVMLSISTGVEPLYINLALGILVVIAVGIIVIKKFLM